MEGMVRLPLLLGSIMKKATVKEIGNPKFASISRIIAEIFSSEIEKAAILLGYEAGDCGHDYQFYY